jgi:transposase-like protein
MAGTGHRGPGLFERLVRNLARIAGSSRTAAVTDNARGYEMSFLSNLFGGGRTAALDRFVAAAVSNQNARIKIPLNRLEELEAALTTEFLKQGKSSRQITFLLFSRWKAYCPSCGKQFSNETLNYLASFYNARGGKGFQCKACGKVLTKFRVVWVGERQRKQAQGRQKRRVRTGSHEGKAGDGGRARRDHSFNADGVCTRCGCSEEAAEQFGWECRESQ